MSYLPGIRAEIGVYFFGEVVVLVPVFGVKWLGLAALLTVETPYPWFIE